MPRGEHDPCRRPNGDGATAADTKPLNSVAGGRCHGHRVCPVIRPAADRGGGCASALAGAAVLSQQRRGWELALLLGDGSLPYRPNGS